MRCHNFLAILLMALLGLVFADTANAMYHPGLGRHMQRDPIGTAIAPLARTGAAPAMSGQKFIQRDFDPHRQYIDGMNLYQYERSNPVQYVDPSGLTVWLRPLNGKVNNRSSHDVNVVGDYVEAQTFLYGSYSHNEYPTTEARRRWLQVWSKWAIGGSITFIVHGPIGFTVPAGDNSTAMRNRGATLVVDVDFITGAPVTVYKDHICLIPAILPLPDGKVGGGTITVRDCPTVTDPNNNSCDGVYLAG